MRRHWAVYCLLAIGTTLLIGSLYLPVGLARTTLASVSLGAIYILLLPSFHLIRLGAGSFWNWLIGFLSFIVFVTLFVGGGSAIHFLLLALMVDYVSFFVSITLPSRARNYLFLKCEKRFHIGSGQLDISPDATYGPLLPLLILWTAAVAAGWFLLPTVDLLALAAPSRLADASPIAAVVGNLINFIVLPGFTLIAVATHFIPNHSRRFKYTLFILPIPLFFLLFLPKSTSSSILRWNEADQALLLYRSHLEIFVDFWSVIAVITVLFCGGLWLRVRSVRFQPGPLGRFLFVFVRARYSGMYIPVLFFISKPLLIVFLAVRYLAIERFRMRPIVYLRSFQLEQAGEIFAKAIAPATARFGVVRGLVHANQPGSALMSQTSFWQFGNMAAVPDSHWQEWVEASLRTASLVVIDASILSESVAWEIQTALRHVPAKRVLIITTGVTGHFGDLGCEIIEYQPSTESLGELRDHIDVWCQRAIVANHRTDQLVSRVAWAALILVAGIQLALTIAGLWALRHLSS